MALAFPQQAILFSFWKGLGGGIVLYRLYSSLLFSGFVLCLSVLVWVTHGRHVSLDWTFFRGVMFFWRGGGIIFF